jgi:hypothetical protein
MSHVKHLEAARVLHRNGAEAEARQILEHLWNAPDRPAAAEFEIFCALLEAWSLENAVTVMGFLDAVVAGEGDLEKFWERRDLGEQATLLEWQGQFHFVHGDRNAAFGSLTRAASLGRDTSLMWRLIGQLHIENEELEIGMRYIRRSLQLQRPTEATAASAGSALGTFSGRHPLGLEQGLEDYLNILLSITKLAKNQKNLRAVRELVVEMIHEHPGEVRLMKIRLLLEKAVVQTSLLPARSNEPRVTRPTETASEARLEVSAPLANPRGYSAYFRR